MAGEEAAEGVAVEIDDVMKGDGVGGVGIEVDGVGAEGDATAVLR